MKRPLLALIDCNNFFVSCERIFRPDLQHKPVVVLSSNDGCVVARSDEAKALGIPMGAPAFKYRQLFDTHKVIRLSGNFELYGDMSRRIVRLLTTITPRIEVYSVDESFLQLDHLPIEDYEKWGKVVRERILEWTSIPVSIGIAPSKTLAKLASDYAKKHPETGGVLHIEDDSHAYLSSTPVESVWGVGWRLSPKLRSEGISNAFQLANMRARRVQQLMGIHGRQMVSELNGVSCYPLEPKSKPRKSIARTRTFGEDTNDIGALQAAIASFTAQASFKLRANNQLASKAGLFLTTSRHKPGYKVWNHEINLGMPTCDTGLLTKLLIDKLNETYNPRVMYHRAGVWLDRLVAADRIQTDLLGSVDIASHDSSMLRMSAVDSLNERYGRRTIYYAAEELGKAWQPKQLLRSPRYLSKWDELPEVTALRQDQSHG